MYLTAHRVRSSSNEEGINAFRHWHGLEYRWPESPSRLPEDDPGRLDESVTRTPIQPGGNRVRGYLDVLAPDGTEREQIIETLDVFAAALADLDNPSVFQLGQVTIRFGVEMSLYSKRRTELANLRVSLNDVLPG